MVLVYLLLVLRPSINFLLIWERDEMQVECNTFRPMHSDQASGRVTCIQHVNAFHDTGPQFQASSEKFLNVQLLLYITEDTILNDRQLKKIENKKNVNQILNSVRYVLPREKDINPVFFPFSIHVCHCWLTPKRNYKILAHNAL